MKNKKLNVIDYMILVVIIAALALVGYKMLKNRNTSSIDADVPVSTASVRFTVLCEDVDAQLAESIQKELNAEDYDVDGIAISPRRVYNSSKMLDAMVISVEAVEQEDGRMTLYFEVDSAPSYASGVYTLGWQEIRLGQSYIMKTLGVEVEGNIVAVEKIG